MLPTEIHNNELYSSSVIVMPVHIKKANWLFAFLHSHKMFSAVPVIMVATDEFEKAFFEDFIRLIGIQVEIVCASTLLEPFMQDPQSLLKSNDAIVNVKKFIGIDYALEHYSYAFVFDCDSIWVGQTDWIGPAVENYDKKTFLGIRTQAPLLNTINRASRSLVDPNETASSLDDVVDIYTWFMDPPLYDRRDFLDFRSYFCDIYGGWLEFLQALKYHSFDYIVYQYFLVSRLGWSIKDYSYLTLEMPENLTFELRQTIKQEFDHNPIWTSMKTCFTAPPPESRTVGLCFHVDRF